MKTYLPLILICSVLVVFRVVECFQGGVPINCAPIAALFVASFFLQKLRGVAVASIIWLLSYPFLSLLQGHSFTDGLFSSILGLAAVVGVAVMTKKSGFGSKSAIFLGSILGVIAFYLVTNCVSWLGMPIYERSLTGFVQAQWTGHPSFLMPTWAFLRNSLIGNSIFAGLIVLSLWKWDYALSPASRKRVETV